MHFTILHRLTAILALTVGLVGIAQAQKPARCQSAPRVRSSPQYEIGNMYRTVESATLKVPPTSVVYISIKPKYFDHKHLVALAEQLKKDFCNEQRLNVLIFCNHRAAREFMSQSEPSKRDLASLRGNYYLNRSLGKEYISYSPYPEKAGDEVRIELSDTKPKQ